MFNLLHCSTNQELFEKHLVIIATTKSILLAVSKDEWDTKEDTGKSMNDALYCIMPKGTSWGWIDIDQWKKPITLVVIELR